MDPTSPLSLGPAHPIDLSEKTSYRKKRDIERVFNVELQLQFSRGESNDLPTADRGVGLHLLH